MDKNSDSRSETEAKEGKEIINNDLPDNKLQTKQQVDKAEDALDTKPAESSFSKKPHSIKGATLKQQAIADVITGSSSSAGMGINAAGRGVSGTVGGILGANNSTPVANKSRSDTRLGKKFDRLATKLNFTPSETFVVACDESKPLADAAGDDQGFNGTYRNEDAKAQKIMGAVPGDLMFQRSLDLIIKDKLYYVEGQQVFQVNSDRVDFNPKKSCFNESEGQTHDVTYHTGNYLHRAFHFGLTKAGKVDYFYADVDELDDGDVSPEIANTAAAHRLIKSNVAELDRQLMDTKAGDEKGELWSPLPRAIEEPTANAYYMSSIEADTGAYVYLAYSKATTNMSFQLNRGPKDGLNEIGPAIEQAVGWRLDDLHNNSLSLASGYESVTDVFTTENYRKGDPTLMIATYDSKDKYKNKADFLLQPRGYRMHLQTADNNMNPLKIPTQLAAVYTGNETYSTIDHEYDAMLPICMTDKANLITTHNFNELSAFVKLYKHKFVYTSTSLKSGYSYHNQVILHKGSFKYLGYDNLYILYKKTAGDGLNDMTRNGVITFNPDSSNGEKEIEVIISTTNNVDGYTLIGTVPHNFDNDVVIRWPQVQAPGEGEEETRSNVSASNVFSTLIETLYYRDAGPYSYSYSDLRNNYIVDVKHPLIEGLISYIENGVGAKMYSLLNGSELFIPLVFSTQFMTLAQLFICAATPWISRVRVNSMKDVIYYEDNIGQYPYSKLDSLKNVPFHNYVNFEFSGYDEPLKTKVMLPATAITWIMPEFFWKLKSGVYVLPWYCNENELQANGKVDEDASAMSFPSIRSGIRLGSLDVFYSMSEKDIRLSLDRLTKQLYTIKTGASFSVYKYGRTTDGQPVIKMNGVGGSFKIKEVLGCSRELGLCVDAPDKLFRIWDGNTLTNLATTEYVTSFRIKIWVNNNTLITPEILARSGVNINRAANYTQKWLSLKASDQNSDTVLAGLVCGMNDEPNEGFKPFVELGNGNQDSSITTIKSEQRALWTRLQLLPFIVSPFDGHPTGDNVKDIYDIAYMLGLCGFRASDYRESVYNREKEVVNQGLLFVSDPWVESSSIVRAGATSSGISDVKGYPIKRS